MPLVSISLVEHHPRLTGYTFSHLPVSNSSAQFAEWRSPEPLGKNHVRKRLSKAGMFQNMQLYIKLIFYIYTVKGKIYTHVHMLYIHLFTVKNMLLRSF